MAANTETTNGIKSAVSSPRSLVQYLQDLRQKGQPIALRLNEQAMLAVQDEGSYQKLLELVERLETIDGLRQGFSDIDEGRFLSLEEFKERVRQSHGISH